MTQKKILVIDDDKNIVELLKISLENVGFVVKVAFDAMQAVREAHLEKPDLIILDIMLPAGSGATVIDRLNLSSDTALIPVIITSCLAPDDIRKRIPSYKEKEKKILLYFQKPFDIKEIANKISVFLSINK